jgi:hypothetical protein
MMSRDAGARDLVRGIADEHGPRPLGLAQNPQRRFRHDAELSLRPADHAQKVVAARVQMRAADLEDLPVHRDHRHAEEVVRRHPVFQAMGPARIHRDVARDGAGELGRRVGGVEEILLFHGARHAQVRAPRLHADEAVVVIHLEHPVQPRDADDHAVRRRQRTARERGARAAGHHRHAFVVADLQDGRDLRRAGGQDHGERRATIGGQRVALVGARLRLVVDDRHGGQHLLKARDDPGFPREDRGVGCGHLHRVSSLEHRSIGKKR